MTAGLKYLALSEEQAEFQCHCVIAVQQVFYEALMEQAFLRCLWLVIFPWMLVARSVVAHLQVGKAEWVEEDGARVFGPQVATHLVKQDRHEDEV